MIKKFRRGVRVPAIDEFYQDGNHYKRIADNAERMLYEVTSDSGGKYYEVVVHGHLYKRADNTYPSKSINDGDEMYQMDEDFGRWAWCWNDLERAKHCFNYKPPVTVDAD